MITRKKQTKNKQSKKHIIAQNRKARFDYFIEQTLEAGISLKGWEVKSLRAGRAQLKESYIIIRQGELFLFGAHITPLKTASSHIDTDPLRNRKLLLHKKEICMLIEKISQKGATAVPLSLYWAKARVKLSLGVAKGKKAYEKREIIKSRAWTRDKNRLLKEYNRK